MRTYWKAAALGAVLLGIAHPVAAPAGDDPPAVAPPSYADKPVDWWIEELAKPQTKAAAELVILKMGVRAEQALAAALVGPDAEVRRATALLLRDAPWVTSSLLPALTKAVERDEADVARCSLRVLRRFGEGARAAVPRMIAWARHEDPAVRAEAISALEACALAGEEGARAAAGALIDESTPLREWAARRLRALGSGAFPAADLLHAATKDPRADVRAVAAQALAACLGVSSAPAAVVAECLTSDDPAVRRAALEGIARVGPKGVEFLPQLTAVLALDDPESVRRAAELLSNLGALATPAVPALLAATARGALPPGTLRSTLNSIGDARVPALVAALADERASVRAHAMGSLLDVDVSRRRLDPAPVLAVALPVVRDPSLPWRERAAATLLGAEAAADDPAGAEFRGALAAWAAAPSTPISDVRACLEAFETGLGRRSRATPCALIVAAAWVKRPGPTPGERIDALRILGPWAQSAPDAAALIAPWIDDPDEALAEQTAERLAASNPGLGLLLESLGSGTPRTRRIAARALGTSPQAAMHAPAIARHLKDADPAVRREAAWAILRLRPIEAQGPFPLLPDLEDLVPVLTEAVVSGDADSRVRALAALTAVGPTARSAGPALRARFGEGDCAAPEFAALVATLSAVDPDGWAELVPALERGLASDTECVRAGCAHAWAVAKGPAARIAPVVADGLSSKDADVRFAALRAAAALGPAVRGLSDSVALHLAERSGPGAMLAAAALEKMGRASKAVFDALIALLKDRRHPFRAAAAAPLVAYGADAVAPLSDGVRDPDIRATSIAALALLANDRAEARAALEAAAFDSDPEVARIAREAVGEHRRPR